MTPPRPAASQHGEDELIVDHFHGKRSGYFMEVGALDGVTFSNTYLLEQEYGWRGLLIEADPEQARLCQQARPAATTVAVAATSPRDAGRPLSLTVVAGAEAWSSLALTGRTRGYIRQGRASGVDLATHERWVPTDTLDNILHRAGAPQHIDFISIDIEGHEYSALQGFSLGKTWSCGVLLIENNSALPAYRILWRLGRARYRYVRTIGRINDWFEPGTMRQVLLGLFGVHAEYARSGGHRVAVAVSRRLGFYPHAQRIKRRFARRRHAQGTRVVR